MITPEAECPGATITHNDTTIGSVVWIGSGVYHRASPIDREGMRLVFCLFYSTKDGSPFGSPAE